MTIPIASFTFVRLVRCEFPLPRGREPRAEVDRTARIRVPAVDARVILRATGVQNDSSPREKGVGPDGISGVLRSRPEPGRATPRNAVSTRPRIDCRATWFERSWRGSCRTTRFQYGSATLSSADMSAAGPGHGLVARWRNPQSRAKLGSWSEITNVHRAARSGLHGARGPARLGPGDRRMGGLPGARARLCARRRPRTCLDPGPRRHSWATPARRRVRARTIHARTCPARSLGDRNRLVRSHAPSRTTARTRIAPRSPLPTTRRASDRRRMARRIV